MKFLRTVFVLLLCAMLPLTGLAASGLAGPCPMPAATTDRDGTVHKGDRGEEVAADEAAGLGLGLGLDDPVPEAMSGCNSMKPAKTAGHDRCADSSSCKMTAQCQAGSLYHRVSLPVLSRPAGRVHPLGFHYAEACPSRSPDGLWRPPRAL